MSQKSTPSLWTRDFTIITVGSVVSMLGNSLAGFAMSLLVLDYTGSTFLFAVYNVLYILPSIVMPAVSGPFLDRFSRKRTIYTLDFITAGLFLAMAGIFALGWFSFPLLAAGCLILGSINSVYVVAYDSFYPLLITEGNYQKAYSVASTLETLTMVMVPLSALIYNKAGIVPLFLADAATYLAAAIMETRIKADERYLADRRITEKGAGRRLAADFKEGLRYLAAEKGLLAVAVYFTFSAFAGGAAGAVTLPYFKGRFESGEYIYMLVWGAASLSRAVGGGIHYLFKMPPRRKFAIALAVYVLTNLFEGVYLFTPVPVMMVLCALTGILGVTSYTIRISATQQYVPDEKKGRFNGAFNTMNTAGSLIGELAAGALAEVLPIRGVIAGVMGLGLLAAVFVIGGNRRHVAAIYNVN